MMLRVNINGQRVVLQTKRYLFPQYWDTNPYQMKGRTREASMFNDYLDVLRIVKLGQDKRTNYGKTYYPTKSSTSTEIKE